MLADELDFVVGVDPHRDSHAIGVEVRSGVVVFESSVTADSRGYAQALRVAEQHAPGRRAFAIEGTGSFGAGLTRFLADHGEQVFEVGSSRASSACFCARARSAFSMFFRCASSVATTPAVGLIGI